MDLNLDILRARLQLSPYYREKLLRLGLIPEDLTGDALSYFPLTERHELLEHSRDILAPADLTELDSTHPFSSTGTSGRRVVVYRGAPDEHRLLKLWEDAAGEALPRRLRILFVCTLPFPKEYEAEKVVGDRTLSIVRRAAERISSAERCDVISGTPRGILAALRAGAASGARLAYSSALPLDGVSAAAIRARLGAPHLHCYSMTETGPIARFCRDCGGSYHVFPDVHVENVEGRLSITKLGETVFPLLRYLSSDRGDVRSGPSECGFSGLTISRLVGRKSDRLL